MSLAIRVTPPALGNCMNSLLQFSGNSVIARVLPVRWPISELCRGNSRIVAPHTLFTARVLRFSRSSNTNAELPEYSSVSPAPQPFNIKANAHYALPERQRQFVRISVHRLRLPNS